MENPNPTTFLTIPIELRDSILKEFFRSITVHHSSELFPAEESDANSSVSSDDDNAETTSIAVTEYFGDTNAERASETWQETINDDISIESANNVSTQNTSILRTCRQLYKDAAPLLAPNIHLHFATTAIMLDTLTTLPSSIIEKLRHMRVKAYPFPLRCDPGYYTTFNMSSTLPMFPGLQLDVLTVEDVYHDPGVNDGWGDCGTYWEVETLLEQDGWKELRFITPTTEFITSANDHRNARVAQPTGWTKKLKERDGETSSAEVKMYVANEKSIAGLAENYLTRSSWDAIPGHTFPRPPPPDWDSFHGVGWGHWVDSREVMIVAKRRAGAKYVQDGRSINVKIKRLIDTMSWPELKKSGKYIPAEDDVCAHL
jgi:hypothetical protein